MRVSLSKLTHKLSATFATLRATERGSRGVLIRTYHRVRGLACALALEGDSSGRVRHVPKKVYVNSSLFPFPSSLFFYAFYTYSYQGKIDRIFQSQEDFLLAFVIEIPALLKLMAPRGHVVGKSIRNEGKDRISV